MLRRVSERGGRLSYSTTPTGKVVYEMNIAVFSLLSESGEPLERSVDRVVCSQAIMLSLTGVPGIYLNSLIGSVNWPEGLIGKPDETEFNRRINEQKFDADTIDAELSDRLSRRSRVFTRLSQLLRARRAEPAFRSQAGQEVLKLHESVFALERDLLTARLRSSPFIMSLEALLSLNFRPANGIRCSRAPRRKPNALCHRTRSPG